MCRGIPPVPIERLTGCSLRQFPSPPEATGIRTPRRYKDRIDNEFSAFWPNRIISREEKYGIKDLEKTTLEKNNLDINSVNHDPFRRRRKCAALRLCIKSFRK